jgi:hypothetical protein
MPCKKFIDGEQMDRFFMSESIYFTRISFVKINHRVLRNVNQNGLAKISPILTVSLSINIPQVD